MMQTLKIRLKPFAPVLVAAGLLACAPVHAAGVTVETGAASYDDETAKTDEKAEKKVKKKARSTIKVIQTGKPAATIDLDGNAIVIRDAMGGKQALKTKMELKAQDKAIESIKKSLKSVEEDLKAASSDTEREVLMTVRKNLMAAVEDLEEKKREIIAIDQERTAHYAEHRVIIHEALANIQLEEAQIAEMRVQMRDELADARTEIQQALEELSIEIDTDGELRRLHIEALREAERDLEFTEKRQIEAMKRAEADLKKAREKLERKLAEREAREAQEAKERASEDAAEEN